MRNYQFFISRVKEFYGDKTVIPVWTRKASTALRRNDVESFNEYMCLVALWELRYYNTMHHGRRRILEAWKNYVFHFRSYNREYYEV